MKPSSVNPGKNLIYNPSCRSFAVGITNRERRRGRTKLAQHLVYKGAHIVRMSLPIV